MQTSLGHIQLNINPANLGWYRDIFGFLGWNTIYDGDGMLGIAGKGEASLWFTPQTKEAANDYDGRGVNHLGIAAESIADVDATAGYLKQQSLPALFETPRHRPEFSSEGQTYYQVMFESPDHILFEVVYTGPK